MGPNVLWLAEALSQVVELRPGMRVLDLGCGKAMSSIFLAREFGVQVWATDLWIEASDNWTRIKEAGLEEQIFPIHAEAHSLPYANGFFDALVSMDSYHYFGTDNLYIGRCAPLVRPGGPIAIVVPGLEGELDDGVPEELAPYWPWDFCSFHGPDWWRRHWTNSGKVEVERADWVPNGWRAWLDWEETLIEHGRTKNQDETQLLRIDGGKRLGFSRVVARVPA
ncbi:MAG: methyltransferase domain-containing protein [Candidatus Latescibacteria bacterium]|nr:methyltransferase domain-containing protein [Candidatus Latescibacterota bacterium]